MPESKKEYLKQGERIALWASVITLILALTKGIVGWLVHSLALVADAFHSGADTIAILASYFGLKLSQRKPTEKFPYGFYKTETLAALIASIFILYAAIEIAKAGFEHLLCRHAQTISLGLPLIVALSSSVIATFLAWCEIKTGKQINSASLVANGQESLTDIFTSLLVVVALVASYFKWPYVEGVVALALAVLVFKIAIENGWDSLLVLLDAGVPKETEKKVEKTILKVSGVRGIRALRLRRSGPFLFGEATILINRFLPLEKSHEITMEIENNVRRKIKNLESLIIHTEPFQTEKIKVALPIQEDAGLDSSLSPHFGRANFFILVNLDRRKITSYEVVENTARTKKMHAGLEAVKILLGHKIDVLIVKNVGEISFHTLRNNLVELHLTQKEKVLEAIKDFLDKKTKILTSPTHSSDQKI